MYMLHSAMQNSQSCQIPLNHNTEYTYKYHNLVITRTCKLRPTCIRTTRQVVHLKSSILHGGLHTDYYVTEK